MVVVKTVQLAGSCLVVVLIAVFVGWFWGAWGTSSRERELRQIELRLALTEARSRILEAQIETGQPYMLYKDSINKKSNQKNKLFMVVYVVLTSSMKL